MADFDRSATLRQPIGIGLIDEEHPRRDCVVRVDIMIDPWRNPDGLSGWDELSLLGCDDPAGAGLKINDMGADMAVGRGPMRPCNVSGIGQDRSTWVADVADSGRVQVGRSSTVIGGS